MVNCLREVGADYLDIVGLITPFVFDQLTPITAWAPIIGASVLLWKRKHVCLRDGATFFLTWNKTIEVSLAKNEPEVQTMKSQDVSARNAKLVETFHGQNCMSSALLFRWSRDPGGSASARAGGRARCLRPAHRVHAPRRSRLRLRQLPRHSGPREHPQCRCDSGCLVRYTIPPKLSCCLLHCIVV